MFLDGSGAWSAELDPVFTAWLATPPGSYANAMDQGVATGDAIVAASFTGDGAGLTGILATIVGYTPAADADWDDPNPVSVQEALDRIAAVVATLNANPIP